MIKRCPCGSALSYLRCCQPIHQSHANAKKPQQLMRARYSAHVLQLVDFVINTYHPSCGAEQQRTEITESIQSHWCGLDVISAERGRCADEGYVHFKAYYQQDGHQFCLEEKSRFVRLDNLWYYIDGQFPDLDEPFRD